MSMFLARSLMMEKKSTFMKAELVDKNCKMLDRSVLLFDKICPPIEQKMSPRIK